MYSDKSNKSTIALFASNAKIQKQFVYEEITNVDDAIENAEAELVLMKHSRGNLNTSTLFDSCNVDIRNLWFIIRFCILLASEQLRF